MIVHFRRHAERRSRCSHLHSEIVVVAQCLVKSSICATIAKAPWNHCQCHACLSAQCPACATGATDSRCCGRWVRRWALSARVCFAPSKQYPPSARRSRTGRRVRPPHALIPPPIGSELPCVQVNNRCIKVGCSGQPRSWSKLITN